MSPLGVLISKSFVVSLGSIRKWRSAERVEKSAKHSIDIPILYFITTHAFLHAAERPLSSQRTPVDLCVKPGSESVILDTRGSLNPALYTKSRLPFRRPDDVHRRRCHRQSSSICLLACLLDGLEDS